MGTLFSCSTSRRDGKGGPDGARRPERRLPRVRLSYRSAKTGVVSDLDATLLDLSLWVLADTLTDRSAAELGALPIDLAQLLLEYLTDTGMLTDDHVAKLKGVPFHELRLSRSPESVSGRWLAALATDRLLVLDLARTSISAADLETLPDLPRLREADLSHLELREGSVDWLRACGVLERLRLSDTSAGAWALRPIGRCVDLLHLDLSRCRLLQGLGPLSGLRRLRSLSLACCPRVSDADLAAAASLPDLADLDISGTGISGPGLSTLGGARSLRRLRLDGTAVGDEAVADLVRRLPRLRALSVARCALVGDATCRAAGAHLPDLGDLDLSRTRVGDAGLRALGPLRSLRSLSLESCARISDAGLDVLDDLRELTSLDLGDCPLTSACVPAIAGLPCLERLSLAFAEIDDAGAAGLARCVSLRELCLDTRSVGDAGVVALCHLPHLESLDLFDARVTDEACGALGQLESLTKLEICSGGLTNAGVARLAEARKLADLSLANNPHVCDGAIVHLLRLRELRTLNLARCGVTTSAVVALGSLESLETLALHGTRVRPAAAAHLAQLNPRLLVKGLEVKK